MARRLTVLTFAIGVMAIQTAAGPIAIGRYADSVRFAVLGDFGNGQREQYEVAEQMWLAHQTFAFDLVLALGDNMYGRQNPADFVDKFEKPYASLLSAGVVFKAALGNHDRPSNREYPPFNMDGRRYYTFVRRHVRFVVLDTNMMDPMQLAWVDQTLAGSTEPWKIVYFHHPLYSNGGRHGSNIELRVALEPIFVQNNVDVVFSGHEHIYERLKPQKGITYFVAGSGGQLRKGDARRSESTAVAFDGDQAFMLVEIASDQCLFQTMSRTGATVDSGVILRRPSKSTVQAVGGLP